MVSVRRGTNSLVEGGSTFGNLEPDVQCLLQLIVGVDKLTKFIPLKTVAAAASLLFLAIVMEIMVLFFVFYPLSEDNECKSYFITIYTHLTFWTFSFILDFVFKKKHHESRLNGYLEFYQKTHHHSRIPFYIISLWNTVLLLVSNLFHEQYKDINSRCKYKGLLTPMNYLCFLITLENLFLVPILVSYLRTVLKFNKSRQCPDVLRDEWMASFVQDSYSSGEVGFREQDNHVEELLEKQADLLRYLKEQNSRLIQKILILNNLLKTQNESLQC